MQENDGHYTGGMDTIQVGTNPIQGEGRTLYKLEQTLYKGGRKLYKGGTDTTQRGDGHYTKGGRRLYKRGTDTKQEEVDSHYKREGDGQYTGGMHIQNVSIPLLNYLFSKKIESVPLFLRMYARLFY